MTQSQNIRIEASDHTCSAYCSASEHAFLVYSDEALPADDLVTLWFQARGWPVIRAKLDTEAEIPWEEPPARYYDIATGRNTETWADVAQVWVIWISADDIDFVD